MCVLIYLVSVREVVGLERCDDWRGFTVIIL